MNSERVQYLHEAARSIENALSMLGRIKALIEGPKPAILLKGIKQLHQARSNITTLIGIIRVANQLEDADDKAPKKEGPQ